MISSCWGLFHVRLPVWYFGEIGMFLFSNIIFYVPRVGEELLVAFPALCMILATFQSEFLWILYWVFYYGRGNFGWWRFCFHVFLSGLFFFKILVLFFILSGFRIVEIWVIANIANICCVVFIWTTRTIVCRVVLKILINNVVLKECVRWDWSEKHCFLN